MEDDFYAPIISTQYESSVTLLTFIMELIYIGADNSMKIIIGQLSENSLMDFKNQMPSFNFLKRDEKSLECILNSLTKSSFPRSGSSPRTAIEESIRAKQNLIEALNTFSPGDYSYLDR